MCDKCVDHVMNINPLILQAIEQNKDQFMAIMEKIRNDMGNILFQAGTSTPEEAAIEDAFPELEEVDNEPDPEDGDMHNLLMASYVMAFLVQQLSVSQYIIPVINGLIQEGMGDGRAYAHLQRQRRH